MADGVDAPMDRVQSSGGHTTLDRLPAQTQGDELAVVHHAVLASRERCDPPLTVVGGQLCSTIGVNCPRSAHTAILTSRR